MDHGIHSGMKVWGQKEPLKWVMVLQGEQAPGKGMVLPGTMPRDCPQGERANINTNGKKQVDLHSEQRAGTPGSMRYALGCRWQKTISWSLNQWGTVFLFQQGVWESVVAGLFGSWTWPGSWCSSHDSIDFPFMFPRWQPQIQVACLLLIREANIFPRSPLEDSLYTSWARTK